MILYFIRHGKTKLNFEKRISGARVDAPLSSSGILELRDYVKEKLYPADPGNCYIRIGIVSIQHYYKREILEPLKQKKTERRLYDGVKVFLMNRERRGKKHLDPENVLGFLLKG